jgi:hypothetical protein
MTVFFPDALTIPSYSREPSIVDGVLVSITDVAMKYRFVPNTVITSSLAAEIDTETRLPILLQTFHEKIKRHQESSEVISAQTISKTGKVITVYLNVGSGDNLEPVLTLVVEQDL